MKRTFATTFAIATLVAFAVPALAAKGGKPGKPGGSFTHPPACTVTEPFHTEPLTPQGARQYSHHYIDLEPELLLATRQAPDLDLCVEVTVESGILTDMNVALIDYPSQAATRCGIYWPGGKLNAGDTFDVGFSLDGYEGQPGFCGSDPDPNGETLTVLVNPLLSNKTHEATLEVTLGFVNLGQ